MQSNIPRNRKAGLATFVFSTYLGVCLARFAFFPANMTISLAMVFIGVSALILCWRNFSEQFVRLLSLPLLLIFGILLSAAMTGRWERILHELVFVMIGYGISFLIIHERINSKAVEVVFGCCALYFAQHMLEGDLAKNVFSHKSYNGISMLMLVCCISLYIVRSTDLKK